MQPFHFEPSRYPEQPGCYIMRDGDGRILYVGKSKKLRSRLRSYFYQKHDRKRIRQLVGEIASIDIILVHNEAESLMLENNLIKLHKPPYNRALKRDNSGYAYLRMTGGPYSRLDVYYRDRRAVKEAPELEQGEEEAGEMRFGPFASARFRNEVLAFINDHYRLRTCTTMPKRVCLLYHIGRCSGICEGMISKEAYQEAVRSAASLLSGGGAGLIRAMEKQMHEYAERMEFERAADMLRHIRILQKNPDKQIVDRESGNNQDIIHFGHGNALVGQVRKGMLVGFGQTAAVPERPGEYDRFVLKHALENPCDEIIVNSLDDVKNVRSALRRAGIRPPVITLPKRGLKYDLLQLCKENLEYQLACAAAKGL
ncbi:nucleotide excision repair endonuclease [Paenibacillus sambharensis]|uniref:Nucleotide excision repair endonuclease n=1 Tax=Paenibacillus sambharensis TaxID=1803190 RepID=A0A2W1L8T6_9BACL|nr:GIY-YIG nuclease family protein [Paenibacillus sambharensis]PZD94550.1 nucleotide excision repair endonuclease [Paenibacillus sambharensis]